jgi:ATP-dependent protease ClpP protease subunit
MAEQKELKYVKGEYRKGSPADMYFYDDVDDWSVKDFLSEFQYLTNYVAPSVIRVHIISCGGVCVEGIKVFSMILGSQIPVETINDGFAASMASAIWAAGSVRYMRDYAILMIHNPWTDEENPSADTAKMTDSFRNQLSLIYKERFGLDDKSVKEIMDGKDGVDGTWYTAEESVTAGFLDAANVIKTSGDVSEKVAASLKGIKTMYAKTDKKNTEIVTNLINNINQKKSEMTENEFKMVAAQLGFDDQKSTGANVTARINELLDKEKKFEQISNDLKGAQEQLSKVSTELEGSKASVTNLTKSLDEAKASLKTYQETEKENMRKRNEELVDAAISTSRIGKESRETWLKMAEDNFDLVKQTLASIPAAKQLSAEIAKDPENLKDAEKGRQSEEEKVKAKVKAIVGDDFKPLTPEF